MQHLRSLPWTLPRSVRRLTSAPTLAGVLRQPSPSPASFSSTVPSASKRTKQAWKAQQYRSQRPPRSQLEPVPSNRLWLSGFSEETTREALLDLFNGHSPSKASIVHRKNRLWAIVDFPSVELASTAKRSLDDSGTVQEAGWTVRFGDENVKVESAKVLKDEFEPSERLYVPVVPAGSTAESLLETYKPLGATSVSLPLHSNTSAFLTFPSINSASAALSTLRSTPSGEGVNFARPIRAFEYLPKAELILTNLQLIPTELLSSALLTASNGLPFELKRESREGTKEFSGWATVKFDTVELAMEVKKALGGMLVGDQRVGVNFPRI